MMADGAAEVKKYLVHAAILKVAELVGGIGLGTGFRSANRSVAGRASPALWGWGSALAGDGAAGEPTRSPRGSTGGLATAPISARNRSTLALPPRRCAPCRRGASQRG